MKQYLISYVSNSGLILLNQLVEANSMSEAIEDIKGDVGVTMILNSLEVKPSK